MSRIREAFAHGKAFIPFITCGDPSVEMTEKIVYAMEEAGADLIELGIPFSDPTAEGPVIQDANLRALSGGITTDAVFEMVRRIRRNTSIPMAFMTYANVVFSYGTERFIRTASEIGMDGLILPDVPFEEKEEFDSVCRKYGLDFISLIAPTSRDRIRMIAKGGSRFCLLRLLARGNGCTFRDHNRCGKNGAAGERRTRYPVCGRIRNINRRTGRKDGGSFGRRDRRFGHCEALRAVQRAVCAVYKRICKENERSTVTFGKSDV